jgi:hypothetical protein
MINPDSVIVNFTPDVLAASGTVFRLPLLNQPPRMLYTTGDAAAAPVPGIGGIQIPTSSTVNPFPTPLWVPPGRVLTFTNLTVADTSQLRFRIVQPRG